MCACFGLFSRALPEAEKAREKRRSGRNSAAQHSRISGTARGGDAEDAGCSNHLTPTIQERPPFGAVFCDIKQTVEHALRPSGA